MFRIRWSEDERDINNIQIFSQKLLRIYSHGYFSSDPIFYHVFSDSPLAHMSDAIIDYVVGKDLLEPLGGAPTSSIIMQVCSTHILLRWDTH